MEITLRDWQKRAYDVFKENQFKGILKVGTGKGKTVFAIHCIKEFMSEKEGFRTCVIVPTINLMFQWRKELLKFLDDTKITLFYGQEKDDSGDVVIYVVNSAATHLEESHASKPFDFLVADECHHYGATLFSKIFEIKVQKALGLSATPHRDDSEGNEKLREGLGSKIFELNHLDDPDAIPPFNIWSILIDLNGKERDDYEENSFKISGLYRYFRVKYDWRPEKENFIDNIKKQADKGDSRALSLLSLWGKQSSIKHQASNKIPLVKSLVEMEWGNKIIIFNERIEFTERLFEALRHQFPTDLFMIHSNQSKKEVQEKLQLFKECEKGVLIAPKLIDEGYDVPDASVAIVASFSKSARQMIQRDGRILRKTGGKESVTRYSIIIRECEEEKYFVVLRRAQVGGKAIEGEWLSYDPNKDFFNSAPEFKRDFIEFEKFKKQNKDEFQEWVLKRLDHYEKNLKNDNVEEIEKRLDFFERFMDVIESLAADYPQRWKRLKGKLERKDHKKGIVRFHHIESHKEREILSKELREVSPKILLDIEIFNAIKRLIENEKFEMSPNIREYIWELTKGERPYIWPEKLFSFLQMMNKKMA